jgi:hypothetical protein
VLPLDPERSPELLSREPPRPLELPEPHHPAQYQFRESQRASPVAAQNLRPVHQGATRPAQSPEPARPALREAFLPA